MATEYMLRNCTPDGTSRDGFQWPKSGPVEAPDWNPAPECGGGLHGWARAMGDLSLGFGNDAKVWIVASYDPATAVDLRGKIKVPRCVVEYYGNRDGAVAYLAEKGICGAWGTATAGSWGTATAGYKGTATAGNWGTATAGEMGEIRIRYLEGTRYRLAVGYVGEDGIEANIAYVVVDGNLTKKT